MKFDKSIYAIIFAAVVGLYNGGFAQNNTPYGPIYNPPQGYNPAPYTPSPYPNLPTVPQQPLLPPAYVYRPGIVLLNRVEDHLYCPYVHGVFHESRDLSRALLGLPPLVYNQ